MLLLTHVISVNSYLNLLFLYQNGNYISDKYAKVLYFVHKQWTHTHTQLLSLTT